MNDYGHRKTEIIFELCQIMVCEISLKFVLQFESNTFILVCNFNLQMQFQQFEQTNELHQLYPH